MKHHYALTSLVLSALLLIATTVSATSERQSEASQSLNKQRLGEQLAANAPQCGRFEQTRWLADLDTQLDSRGVFQRRDDALIWHTRSPVNDRLELSADDPQLPIGLQVMLPVFNGLLSGDWQALERYFSVTLEGQLNDWQAQLTPKGSRLAERLDTLQVSGTSSVDNVEIGFTGGDRLELALTPSNCDRLSDQSSAKQIPRKPHA